MFLAGIIIGGTFLAAAEPRLFNLDGLYRSEIAVVVSGVVMGFGGRMANGCTSGHGMCGICQMSKRSLVATGVFFSASEGFQHPENQSPLRIVVRQDWRDLTSEYPLVEYFRYHFFDTNYVPFWFHDD